MFKVESYVTPLILSYVEKYIKNLRPEDSQVSLWGGEVVFSNLDLRLGVLEEEFQLPFSFVNGHIHELRIQVPWTRLATEPIIVTVNTLECVLKLNAGNERESFHSSSSRSELPVSQKPSDDAPPGYIPSLVAKVVQNVAIVFNNVILKYVEDDMVLSLNVRSLRWNSCDAAWTPAFIDVASSVDLQMRKVATLSDLTICLDKRNAHGKIDYYLDPLVYRCTLDCRMSFLYDESVRRNGARRAKATQLSIYCKELNVSLTDEQLPMFIRLASLAYAVIQGDVSPRSKKVEKGDETSSEFPINSNPPLDDGGAGWASWAWNLVPSVGISALIGDEYEQTVDGEIITAGSNGSKNFKCTSLFGFYVDSTQWTLKRAEKRNEGKFKVTFEPFCRLEQTGSFFEALSTSDGLFSHAKCGFAQAILRPLRKCPCGAVDTLFSSIRADGNGLPDREINEAYLTCGNSSESKDLHVKASLFDPENPEMAILEVPLTLEEHLAKCCELEITARAPAVSMDYVYFGENGDDSAIVQREGSWMRMFVGSTEFSVDSGCLHRLEVALNAVADCWQEYNYSSRFPGKASGDTSDRNGRVDDFENAEDAIKKMEKWFPFRHYRIFINGPIGKLYPFIHGKLKKSATSAKNDVPLTPLPNISSFDVGCRHIEITRKTPMFPDKIRKEMVSGLVSTQDILSHFGYDAMKILVKSIRGAVVTGEHSALILHPSDAVYSLNTFVSDDGHFAPTVPRQIAGITVHDLKLQFTVPQVHWLWLLCRSLLYRRRMTGAMTEQKMMNSSQKCTLTVSVNDFAVTQSSTVGKFFAYHGNLRRLRMIISKPDTDGCSRMLPLFEGGDVTNELLRVVLQIPVPEGKSGVPLIIAMNVSPVLVCFDETLMPEITKEIILVARGTKSGSKKTRSMASFVGSDFSQEGSSSVGDNRSESSVPSKAHHSAPKFLDVHQMLSRATVCITCAGGHLLLRKNPAKLENAKVWTSSGFSETIEILKRGNQAENSSVELFVVKVSLLSHQTKSDLTRRLPSFLPVLASFDGQILDSEKFPFSISIIGMSANILDQSGDTPLMHPTSAEGSLVQALRHTGVCLHIDMSPIAFTLKAVHLFEIVTRLTVILHSIMDLLEKFYVKPASNNIHSTVLAPNPVPTLGLGVTARKSPSMDSLHDSGQWTSVSVAKEAIDKTSSSPILRLGDGTRRDDQISFWLQGTLPKATFVLFYEDDESTKKVIVEIDELSLSCDWQLVFYKLKLKIMGLNIFHRLHDYTQDVMKGAPIGAGFLAASSEAHQFPRDLQWADGCDASPLSKHVPLVSAPPFLQITLTVADAVSDLMDLGLFEPAVKSIVEFDFSFQALDVVLCHTWINPLMQKIIFPCSQASKRKDVNLRPRSQKRLIANGSSWMSLGVSDLPLIYFQMGLSRVFLPDEDNSYVLLNCDMTRINTCFDDHLSRTILQEETYKMAESFGCLCVPGAVIENRMYSLLISNVSLSAGNWNNLLKNVSEQETRLRTLSQDLKIMSENPALEWNVREDTVPPRAAALKYPSLYLEELWSIVSPFDVKASFAPAILFSGQIVSPHSIELSTSSNLEVTIGPNHIDTIMNIQKLLVPLLARNGSGTSEKHERVEDFDLGSLPSFELFLTSRGLKVTLCGNLNSVNQDAGSSIQEPKNLTSEEAILESSRASSEIKRKVILTGTLQEPYCSVRWLPLDRKAVWSCYDMTCKTNSFDILSTKTGQPDERTGVLASVFTLMVTDMPVAENGLSRAALKVDIGRPLKIDGRSQVFGTVWNDLMADFGKFLESRASEKNYPVETFNWNLIGAFDTELEQLVVVWGNVECSMLTAIRGASFNSYYVPPSGDVLTGFYEATGEILDFEILCQLQNQQKKFPLLSPVLIDLSVLFPRCGSFPLSQLPCSGKIRLSTEVLKIFVGAPQVFCVENAWQAFALKSAEKATEEGEKCISKFSDRGKVLETSDDLRSGLLKIINVEDAEVLAPGFVMVDESSGSLSWHYREPRAISKLVVTPLPFLSTSENFKGDEESADVGSLTCRLQHWCWFSSCFKDYTSFRLSESNFQEIPLDEVCIPFPGSGSTIEQKETRELVVPVSSIWRIVIGYRHSDLNEKEEKSAVSPRALLACVGIDSAFIPELTPVFEIGVKIGCCIVENEIYRDLSLDERAQERITRQLSFEIVSNQFPSRQVWSVLEISNFDFRVVTRSDGRENEWISSHLRCGLELRVTRASHLTESWVARIPSLTFDALVFLASGLSDCRLSLSDLLIRWGVVLNEEIQRSMTAWNASLIALRRNVRSDATGKMVALSMCKYLISNCTSEDLSIGQNFTDECLHIPAGKGVPYVWRSNRGSRLLRIKSGAGSRWSDPLALSKSFGVSTTTLDAENRAASLIAISRPFPGMRHIIHLNLQGCVGFFNLNLFAVNAIVERNERTEVCHIPDATRNCKVGLSSVAMPLEELSCVRFDKDGNSRIDCSKVAVERLTTGTCTFIRKSLALRTAESDSTVNVCCTIVRDGGGMGFPPRIVFILSPMYAIKSIMPSELEAVILTPARGQVKKVQKLPACKQGSFLETEAVVLNCPFGVDANHQISFRYNSEEWYASVPLSPDMIHQVGYPDAGKINPDLSEMETVEEPGLCVERILESLRERQSVRKWDESGCVENRELGNESESSTRVVVQPRVDLKVTYERFWPYLNTLLLEVRPELVIANNLKSGCSFEIIAMSGKALPVAADSISICPKFEEPFDLMAVDATGVVSDWRKRLVLSWQEPRLVAPPAKPTSPGEIASVRALVDDDEQLNVPMTSTVLLRMLRLGKGRLTQVLDLALSSRKSDGVRVIAVEPRWFFTNYTNEPIMIQGFRCADENFDPDICMVSSPCKTVLSPDRSKATPISSWILHGDPDSPSDCYVKLSLSFVDHEAWASILIGSENDLNKDTLGMRKHVVVGTDILVVAVVPSDDGVRINVAVGNELNPAVVVHNTFCGQTFRFASLTDNQREVEVASVIKIPPAACIPCALETEDEDFANGTLSKTAGGVRKFALSALVNDEWSEWVEFRQSDDEAEAGVGAQFLRLVSGVDVQIGIEMSGYTRHLFLLPVHRIEVRASSVRNRIGSADGKRESPPKEELKLQTSEPDRWMQVSSRWVTSGRIVVSRLVVTLLDDFTDEWRSLDCFSLVLIQASLAWRPQFKYSQSLRLLRDKPREFLEVSFITKDLQFENSLARNEEAGSGSFDFPIIIQTRSSSNSAKFGNDLITMHLTLEPVTGPNSRVVMKRFRMSSAPITLRLEDVMWRKLGEVTDHLLSWHSCIPVAKISASEVPESVAQVFGGFMDPLFLEEFSIEALTVEVSVHASVKLYLAINQSSLNFSAFQRRDIRCLTFKLGKEVSRHYFFGAVVRAAIPSSSGFVLGSLDLLGSPSVLMREVKEGIKDCIALPYQAMFGGPREFVRGLSVGTKSLLQHVTSGTLSSFTNMAGSMAHNLEALSWDDEHRNRALNARRLVRNKGLIQGFQSGLSEFGISLLGAIGGIAHHPLEAVMAESDADSSAEKPHLTTSVVAGLGKGLVGFVTKPLGGAAHLLASTGQGLLQAAGWGPKMTHYYEEAGIHREEDAHHGLLWPCWKISPLTENADTDAIGNPFVLIEVTRVEKCSSPGEEVAVEVVYSQVSLFLAGNILVVIDDTLQTVLNVFDMRKLEWLEDDDPTLIGFKLRRCDEPWVDEETKLHDLAKERVEAYLLATASKGWRKAPTSVFRKTLGTLKAVASSTSAGDALEPVEYRENPESAMYPDGWPTVDDKSHWFHVSPRTRRMKSIPNLLLRLQLRDGRPRRSSADPSDGRRRDTRRSQSTSPPDDRRSNHESRGHAAMAGRHRRSRLHWWTGGDNIGRRSDEPPSCLRPVEFGAVVISSGTSSLIGSEGESSSPSSGATQVLSNPEDSSLGNPLCEETGDCASNIERVKDYGWYWGPISSTMAENVLSEEPDGSFIVRDSSDSHYIFSLSFKFCNNIKHVRIDHDHGNFSFGSCSKFRSRTIVDFVENAVEHSRSGRFLFFWHRRAGQSPLQVQLINPVSRFVIVRHLRKDLIPQLPLPGKLKEYLSCPHYYFEGLTPGPFRKADADEPEESH
ncbi:unnamed protein product [Notodromas monacha]|uniref:SH2 domain-containing protein n=1 Tax=Notodromas monacha TaxID=399045 RepID=A0A7R9BLV2_9CRUS|nr:unnamed protein product [Notodromas monacha]CAG0916557.1 unnamed protein product [Notodromas monacha]